MLTDQIRIVNIISLQRPYSVQNMEWSPAGGLDNITTQSSQNYITRDCSYKVKVECEIIKKTEQKA